MPKHNPLLHQFVVSFLNFERVKPPATGQGDLNAQQESITLFDFIRLSNEIDEAYLLERLTVHFDQYVCKNRQKALLPLIFISENGKQIFSKEFLACFKEEAGLSAINRHAATTILSFVLTGVAAAALSVLGIFIYEAASGIALTTGLFAAMPFLAALGPMGALALTVLVLTLAAYALYGIVVGGIAFGTSKNIEVTRAETAPDGQMSPLSSTPQRPDVTHPKDAPAYFNGPLSTPLIQTPASGASPSSSNV